MVKKDETGDDIVVRKSEKADFPVLVEFLAKLALHVAGSPPQTLKKQEQKRLRDFLTAALDDPDKLVLVADHPEAGVVAMGYVYVWRSQGIWEQAGKQEFRSGVIDDIWVEPGFRKLGIFSKMVAELVAFADSRGAQELVLEYSVSNQEAEAAWKKLGFKITGVRAAAFTGTVKEKLARR